MDKNFTPNANGALQAKLIELLGKSKVHVRKHKDKSGISRNKFKLSDLNGIGLDGENHINISDCGVTPLGQLLAFSNNLRFTSQHLGPFMNINALWRYITIDDCPETIRNMHNFEVRRLAKEAKTHNVSNLPAIIMTAVYERIKQWPDICQAVVESDLPFDLYYYPAVEEGKEKVRQRLSISSWVIEGIEEIRDALKEEREPCFKSIMTKQNSPLYGDLPKYVAKKKNKHNKNKAKEVQAAVDGALVIASTEEHRLQIEHGRKALEDEIVMVTNAAGEVSSLRDIVENGVVKLSVTDVNTATSVDTGSLVLPEDAGRGLTSTHVVLDESPFVSEPGQLNLDVIVSSDHPLFKENPVVDYQ